MASPDFATVAPRGSSTSRSSVDAVVERLRSKKDAWIAVDTQERAELLRRCIDHTLGVAAEWVLAACEAKGIDPDSPRAGEEWLGGPVTTVRNLRLLADAMLADGEPAIGGLRQRAEDQFVVDVFPLSLYDRIALAGIRAEVWLEKGRPPTQGRIYRQKADRSRPKPNGKVSLVLGAGNVASIGPMDALHKLFIEDEVVLVKTNPVNAYLQPYWEAAFRPLLDADYFAVVRGGAEIGSYLCHHPHIDTIHMTGSDRTHDAIVWGSTPEEQAKNKRAGTPKLAKPISSELGAVTPCIVVPGPWSEADLRFQARHVASMVTNNASFNCNACKILVTAKGWPQRTRFLELVHEALANIPARKAYYPGAQERYQRFLDRYPDAKPLAERTRDVVPWTILPDVPPTEGEYALSNEAFCGVLAEVTLDEADPGRFMERATKFANDDCWGTLSCMLLIDPNTARAHARSFDRMLAELRYGGIAVNAWAAIVYGLVTTTWGAYPGHPLEDVRSGRGTVHNALLLDHPEKSIVYAPFRMSPTPAWFADHRTLQFVGPALSEFEGHPSLPRLVKLAMVGLRG